MSGSVEIVLMGTQGKVMSTVPRDVLIELDEICSYTPLNIEYSEKVESGEWDGVVHLFRNRAFPIGLLGRVQLHLAASGLDVEIRDMRRVGPAEPMECTYEMRGYQERIVRDAIAERQALIGVAVGGGKTVIATEIIARLGLRTLFIAPSIEIMNQTKKVLQTGLNITPGVLHQKIFRPGRVTVATWQTLSARIKARADNPEVMSFLQSIDCVFVDEVHHLSADNIFNVAMNVPAVYRYGLSGSLFRTDNTEIKYHAGIGEIVPGCTASELIGMGYLVPPTIQFRRSEAIPFGWSDKWRQVYEQGVVYNKSRNQLIAFEAQRLIDAGRWVLVLVSEVAHGEILAQFIPDAIFLESGTKGRDKIIENFRNRNICCLISTTIMDEGVDIPHIDAVVLAGAGKCLNERTRVVTTGGVKSLHDIGMGTTVLSYDGTGERLLSNVVEAIYDNGTRETRIIKTKRGFVIEGTPEHRIMCMDVMGALTWRSLEELCIGDYVPICYQSVEGGIYENIMEVYAGSGIGRRAEKFPLRVWSKELCELMGYYVSEGSLYKNTFTITTGNEHVRERVTALCSFFGFRPLERYSPSKHAWDIRVHSAHFVAWVNSVSGRGAGGKFIPESVFRAPAEARSMFLRAYLDGDGTYSAHTVECTSVSEQLSADIQQLLLTLGIVSTRRVKNLKKSRYSRPWTVSILADFLSVFHSAVGTFVSDSCHDYEEYALKRRNTNLNIIPHQQKKLKEMRLYARCHYGENISVAKARAVGLSLSSLPFFYDVVESKTVSVSRVRDIEICDSHCYIAAGFVSHNSPIKAVQRVGRALRTHPGKKDAIIIDFADPVKYLWEHSRERCNMYRREPAFRIVGAVPQ